MRLPPPRAVGVFDSGADISFLVSSGSAGAAPAPAGGEGPPPPHAQVGRLEGCSVVLKGYQSDYLIASWLFHGQPQGGSSHFWRERLGNTGPLRPSGGILAAYVTEFFKGQLPVQSHLAFLNSQKYDRMHIMVLKCMQHWWAVRIVGPVPWDLVLGRPQGGGIITWSIAY